MMKGFRNIFRPSSASSDEKYLQLINRLIDERVIDQESAVASALQFVKRSPFLFKGTRSKAYTDAPVTIPCAQTNSQPTTVAIMLRELSVQPGNHVLDVGFGSGWTTVLLAVLGGIHGMVWGIEILPSVYAFGAKNIEEFSQKNGIPPIELMQGDGKKGLPHAAPFDRILVSAAADAVPKELVDQLASGGRMVVPVRSGTTESLYIIEKDQGGRIHSRSIPGFRFVPLV